VLTDVIKRFIKGAKEIEAGGTSGAFFKPEESGCRVVNHPARAPQGTAVDWRACQPQRRPVPVVYLNGK
jgi:hypothetical protein